MQTNILWKGHLYNSLENCLFTVQETGIRVNSVIVGVYGRQIFRVEYSLHANEKGATTFLELHTQVFDKQQTITFESDGNGHWTKNGVPAFQLEGCIDVDISLTPFTNTLPVRRLRLRPGKTERIRVVYCDILNGSVKPVFQQYTHLSKGYYKFENVPNDFEAIITVEDQGLVVNYPELFIMAEAQQSAFPVNE